LDPPGTGEFPGPNETLLTTGVWSAETFDLLEVLEDPARIARIRVGRAGLEFESRVDNVQISCGEGGTEKTPFRRGDADGSGVVDISDPLRNLEAQFLGSFMPPCLDALDTDDSGAIDISDPVQNLTFQFLGTFMPPSPGPMSCGQDDTDDFSGRDGDLGCENYPAENGTRCDPQ
jgi:hypothetical protein